MESIKIEVNGNIAKVVGKPAVITAGTVGLPVEFTYDSDWDGLRKTASFKACTEHRSVDNIGNETTVPWEVLQKPGARLYVSVHGENEDCSIVIPTAWVSVCLIKPGADPGGDPSADPTQPIWKELMDAIDSLRQAISFTGSYILGDGETIDDAPRDVGVVIDPNGNEGGVLYFKNKNGEFEEVPAIAGRSAYQTALDEGFKGTESEWLESLKGKDGYTPKKGVDYHDGKDGYTPQKGVDYEDGKDGVSPVKGEDYWTPEDKQEMKDYANDCGANVLSITASRALTVSDTGKFLCVDAAASITVPANIPDVGMEVEVFRNTSETVTIVAGSGVSFALPGRDSLVTESQAINYKYESAVLKQIATNVWSIQGAV